ncbi:MAG: hypothetical protein ACK55I_46045, partial [bacterium]
PVMLGLRFWPFANAAIFLYGIPSNYYDAEPKRSHKHTIYPFKSFTLTHRKWVETGTKPSEIQGDSRELVGIYPV